MTAPPNTTDTTPAAGTRRGPAVWPNPAHAYLTPDQIDELITANRRAGWTDWEINTRYGHEYTEGGDQ